VSTLDAATNAAVVVLFAELFVLSLVLLAAVYWAVHGLGRLWPRLRLWLRIANEWTLQAEVLIAAAMRRALWPILFISGLNAGVRETWTTLRRRPLNHG